MRSILKQINSYVKALNVSKLNNKAIYIRKPAFKMFIDMDSNIKGLMSKPSTKPTLLSMLKTDLALKTLVKSLVLSSVFMITHAHSATILNTPSNSLNPDDSKNFTPLTLQTNEQISQQSSNQLSFETNRHSHSQQNDSFNQSSVFQTSKNNNYATYPTLNNHTSYGSQAIELPELGSGGTRFIEANQHKALGEWSLQQLARTAPMLEDPWSQDLLESMAWRINSEARSQAPLALVVINNPSINAFAIPGGVMGINTGTIIESNSIDEVASVIAHEVAHLSQRHYENKDDANRKALMLQIGGILAAIAASTVDGDAATAVMMGSQTAALNSQMAFSRSNEREADRIGMQLMAKSGYDPRAMPKFFGTLNQKTQLNTTNNAYLPSFIMTHPLSSERLSEAQSRANSYDVIAINQQRDPLLFDLLKWRIKVLTNQANERELVAAASSNKGAALDLAYWYGVNNRFSEANALLVGLKNTASSVSTGNSAYGLLNYQNGSLVNDTSSSSFAVLVAITEAQILGKQNKWAEAEAILTPLYNVFPERRDIKLHLADAWLNLGKFNQVVTTLKPVVSERPNDLEALSRIQRAYELNARELMSGQINTREPSINEPRTIEPNKSDFSVRASSDNSDNSDSSYSVNQNAPQTNDNTRSNVEQTQLLAKIAEINALRYRAKGELWRGRYNDALVSLEQAKSLANNDNTNSVNQSLRPLLASIDNEITEVKTARDFSP